MQDIIRSIHEAEDSATALFDSILLCLFDLYAPNPREGEPDINRPLGCSTRFNIDALVIAFLKERIAMLDMLDSSGTMWAELRSGIQTEIYGRKLKLDKKEAVA